MEKRTDISDAHDRYANQKVSFLLQKMEDHSGLVIMAINMKNNIHEVFTRRFHLMIHFPIPKAVERYQLWKNAAIKNTRRLFQSWFNQTWYAQHVHC